MATKSPKTNTQELAELFLKGNKIYGSNLSKKEMGQLIIKQSKVLADTAKAEKKLDETLAKPPPEQWSNQQMPK